MVDVVHFMKYKEGFHRAPFSMTDRIRYRGPKQYSVFLRGVRTPLVDLRHVIEQSALASHFRALQKPRGVSTGLLLFVRCDRLDDCQPGTSSCAESGRERPLCPAFGDQQGSNLTSRRSRFGRSAALSGTARPTLLRSFRRSSPVGWRRRCRNFLVGGAGGDSAMRFVRVLALASVGR